MTALLSKAFERASVLPDGLQDELARELMAEIEWELAWDASLSATADKIDAMAEDALRQHRNGATKQAGIDEL